MANEPITIVDNLYDTRKSIAPGEIGYDARLAELLKTRGRNIYSITHSRDLDGVGSAAMLVHYFKMPVKNSVFTGYTAEEFAAASSEILGMSPKGAVIVLADLGMDAHLLDSIGELFDRLRKDGNTILWLDHHHWLGDLIDGVSKRLDFLIAGENPSYCAAEIVYRVLCKRDEFGDRLAHRVHLSDFKPVDTPEYMELEKIRYAINYFHWRSKAPQKKLRRLADYVSKGIVDNGFIDKAYRAGKKMSEERLSKMVNGSVAVDAGVRIAIGFGRNVVTNDACRELMAKHDADIGLYVSKDHYTAHMRSSDDVDCSLLARAFGGNGHPQAAGFPIDKNAFGKMDAKARKGLVGLVKEKAVWTYSK